MKPKLSLRSIELLSLLALLLLSLGLRLWYIPKNLFDYDEGHWLMFGALAAQGYTPYTELFVGIAPLGLNSLRLSWLLFGSELTVRIPMMLYSLVGIAAIYWLVKQQARRYAVLAGLIAAILLSFHPEYFIQSATVMTEVPAIALALLSLALVEKYRQSRASGWLALAGAAAAASVLVKVFVIFLPVLAGMQLLFISGREHQFSPAKWRNILGRFLKLGLWWLAGVMLVFLPFLLLYNPVAMYTEVLHFRFLLREVKLVQEGLTVSKNFSAVTAALIDNLWHLSLIALATLLTSKPDQLRRIWWWPAWFGLAFAALAIQIPFRDRYIAMLVPPLVALTGLGGARLAAWLTEKFSPRQPNRFAAVGLALVLAVAAFNCVGIFTAPPEESWLDAEEVGRYASARFVHRISAPDDCIVVDDQRFAFLAGRLVPPWLSETSDARFQVGWLTSDVVAETIAKNDCVALVYISDRLTTHLPDLDEKAAEIFALELAFSDSEDSRFTTVYVIPYQLQKRPALPLNYTLGNVVTLKGIDATPGPWAAKQEISLSSYWQATQPILKDYKIFVHINNAAGQTVATFDHYPFETKPDDYIWSVQPTGVDLFESSDTVEKFKNYPAAGLLPTRLWPVGQTLKETLTVRLPDSLPPGDYDISIGLYDEATGERLPMQREGLPVENNEAAIRNLIFPMIPLALLAKKKNCDIEDVGPENYDGLTLLSSSDFPQTSERESLNPLQHKWGSA